MEAIKRQKIEQRDDFTDEERWHISAKSDNRCCHCGKEVYWGYGATIDHFIPLSEGGVNRDYNLIMLCRECNQEKRSKICEPLSYLKYLNAGDKRKLVDYFNSYIKSFDFFEKRNMMACDEYSYKVCPGFMFRHRHKPNVKPALYNVILRRASDEDRDKIQEYYAKYLKKYGMVGSDEWLKADIDTMFKYGCIYYVQKGQDISTMCFVTIGTEGIPEPYKGEGMSFYYTLNLLIMPYYNTQVSQNMSTLLAEEIPETIIDEQELNILPVRIMTIIGDSFLLKWEKSRNHVMNVDDFYSVFHEMLINDMSGQSKEEQKKHEDETQEFLKKRVIDIDGFDEYFRNAYKISDKGETVPGIYDMFFKLGGRPSVI